LKFIQFFKTVTSGSLLYRRIRQNGSKRPSGYPRSYGAADNINHESWS